MVIWQHVQDIVFLLGWFYLAILFSFLGWELNWRQFALMEPQTICSNECFDSTQLYKYHVGFNTLKERYHKGTIKSTMPEAVQCQCLKIDW